MDIKKCEAFLTAAESGSFTAAAQLLDLSQVAVTRLIQGLEEELGYSLFSRSKKGVVLTENGKIMLPAIREMVQAGRKAEQLSADIRGAIKGVLKIGSYYSIAAMSLPEVIKQFKARYPLVQVRLLEGGNREMKKWLSERSVDCCFLSGSEAQEFDWTPLFQDELVAWLPMDHPKAKAGVFPLKQLNRESFIHTQPGEDTELDRLLRENALHPSIEYTTQDAFTTYNMVEAGLGISLNQRLITKKWSGKVALVPFDPPQYLSLGVAVPSEKEMSPATKKFIECALELL